MFKVNISEVSAHGLFSTKIVSLTTSNKTRVVEGVSKIVSPLVTYEENGEFTVRNFKDDLDTIYAENKYYPGSPDFTLERINDVLYSRVSKVLSEAPTINKFSYKGKEYFHPLALLSYDGLINLQPSEEFSKKLSRLSFNKQGDVKAQALQELSLVLKAQVGFELDLYSIPKKNIGGSAHLVYKDGYSKIAYTLGFGMHYMMPRDRIVREANSLKNAELFSNPVKVDVGEISKSVNLFTSMIRVAFIFTETSMLDSGDLFPSGVPKVASRLTRELKVNDLKFALDKYGKGNLNLTYLPNKSSIDVAHIHKLVHDETQSSLGPIRLVLPNGLKLAAQPQSSQAYDSQGQPIDMFIDYRSLSTKGAVSLILMCDPRYRGKNLSLEEAFAAIPTIELKDVHLNGVTYKAFVGEIPVFRPGQRYTDLTKPTDTIASDLITKAILKEQFIVSDELEAEYAKYRQLIFGIERQLS